MWVSAFLVALLCLPTANNSLKVRRNVGLRSWCAPFLCIEAYPAPSAPRLSPIFLMVPTGHELGTPNNNISSHFEPPDAHKKPHQQTPSRATKSSHQDKRPVDSRGMALKSRCAYFHKDSQSHSTKALMGTKLLTTLWISCANQPNPSHEKQHLLSCRSVDNTLKLLIYNDKPKRQQKLSDFLLPSPTVPRKRPRTAHIGPPRLNFQHKASHDGMWQSQKGDLSR